MSISKVASDQNRIDQFKTDLIKFDGKNSQREKEMDQRFVAIQGIERHTNDQYDLMKKERAEIARKVQLQDDAIDAYKDELSLTKIRLEAEVKSNVQEMQNVIDKYTL